MKYYIKKSNDHGDYYLSPLKRRWISVNSRKHKFGKFTEDECLQFINHKLEINPKGKYERVPAK
jgi:hypothetical protein